MKKISKIHRNYLLVMAPLFVAILSGVAFFMNAVMAMRVSQILVPHAPQIQIWGDSRTYEGIETEEIASKCGLPVFNHSQHGADIYDLAVFAEHVPSSSSVVIGGSLPYFNRDFQSGFDRSGLSLGALSALFQFHYPIKELSRIFFNNLWVTKTPIFTVSSPPNPNQLELESGEWALYEEKYTVESVNEAYQVKPLIFRKVVARLASRVKEVQIILLPVSENLHRLTENSVYRDYRKWFQGIANVRYYEPVLNSQTNILFDHSHLNERGRALFTNYVTDHLANYCSTYAPGAKLGRDIAGE